MSGANVFRRLMSLSAACDAALTPSVNPESESVRKEALSFGIRRASWLGIPRSMDFPQLREFWSTGWPEGAARIRESMGKVAVPALTSVRRRQRWSDAGDELSRDRLMAGDLDRAWRTTARVNLTAPRIVRVVVDVAGNCNVSADELFWRGAAGASLSEALTAAGYSVEIVAASVGVGTSNQGENVFTATIVKQANSPLNLTAVAATTASAGFFRTVLFSLYVNSTKGRGNSGYGRTESLTNHPAELKALGIAGDQTTRMFLVPGSVHSKTSAQAWVDSVVADLEASRAA